MEMINWSGMDLPGFRFHPTEEELLEFYLKGAVHGKKLQPEIIQTLNIYRHDPRELPGMAGIGEREWYFFVPRDRRSNNSGKPNRTTEHGFWKATGSDRHIRSVSEPGRVIGVKKTLVFYMGRAPRGSRTDWVMNEYRLPEDNTTSASPPKEDIVLCKIYRKATSMKLLEQLAAMDNDAKAAPSGASTPDNSTSSSSSSSDKQTSLQNLPTLPPAERDVGMEEVEVKVKLETEKEAEITSVPMALDAVGKTMPLELEMLQVPPSYGFDWSQDPFLTQLRSPWLDNWSPYYKNALSL